ncbi:MAG: hypothetical protein J1G01_03445 [Clostridiales bacterium]|nr:hypothetical protein [Clostridiales bacterium]
MIKRGIKNYFISLKYVFTILGTLALGVVFGLSILIPGVISAFSDLYEDIVKVVSSTDIDVDALRTFVLSSVRALDWSNPIEAVKTIFSQKWLTAELGGFLDALVGDTSQFEAQILSAVQTCLDAIFGYVVAFGVLTLLGLIGGFYFTKWLVRRGIAKRKFRMFIAVTFVETILSATLIAGTLWLAAVWWKSVFITTVAMILLGGAISLVGAYIVHGRGKIGFKKIVNVKNILLLTVTNAIVFLLSLAFTVAAMFINIAAGVFIGMAFVALAFIVIGLNAEAYVKGLAEECETKAESGETCGAE